MMKNDKCLITGNKNMLVLSKGKYQADSIFSKENLMQNDNCQKFHKTI